MKKLSGKKLTEALGHRKTRAIKFLILHQSIIGFQITIPSN
jgi:hypothetical protein